MFEECGVALFPSLVQTARLFFGVDALDGPQILDLARQLRALVALQPADEVPANALGQQPALLDQLLYVVLAKVQLWLGGAHLRRPIPLLLLLPSLLRKERARLGRCRRAQRQDIRDGFQLAHRDQAGCLCDLVAPTRPRDARVYPCQVLEQRRRARGVEFEFGAGHRCAGGGRRRRSRRSVVA